MAERARHTRDEGDQTARPRPGVCDHAPRPGPRTRSHAQPTSAMVSEKRAPWLTQPSTTTMIFSGGGRAARYGRPANHCPHVCR